MLKIKKEHVIYEMTAVNPPAVRVRSGEQVCFETMDCYGETMQSEQDTVSLVPWKVINPATGPLYVEGAMPGDVLRVEIQYIRLSNQGVMAVGPGAGALRCLLKEERTKLLTIQDSEVVFNDRLRFPLSPMVGVIGTAPKGKAVPNGTPGCHGSNMDCKLICEGSVLYLPVNVEGALLAVGDLHAAMGDGEVVICGVETSGEVIVQTDVIKDFSAYQQKSALKRGASLLPQSGRPRRHLAGGRQPAGFCRMYSGERKETVIRSFQLNWLM